MRGGTLRYVTYLRHPPHSPPLPSPFPPALQENAGTPCVYAVAERLREWLQAHNEPAGSGSAYDEMLKRQKAKDAPAGERGGRVTARGRRCRQGARRYGVRCGPHPGLPNTRKYAHAHSSPPTPLPASTTHPLSAGGASGPSALSRADDPSIKHKVVVSAQEEDEALRRKREGTPVTPESFAVWSGRYEAECEELRRREEEAGTAHLSTTRFYGPRPIRGRLTGRQMFEQDSSLAFSDAALLEAEGAVLAGGLAPGAVGANGSGVPIDTSLFAGEDDLGDDLEGLELDDSDEDDSDYEGSDDDEEDGEEDDDDDEDVGAGAGRGKSGGGGGGGGGGKGIVAGPKGGKR